ncbi:multidrug effflux MFS transporter [Fundidesulfovibrio butyratiphilus]
MPNSSPSRLKRTPRKAAVVVILGLLTAFAPFATDMYLSGLPALARSFHTNDAQAQLTLSTFFFGLAVGQFFYGPLSDRLGRRAPLLFGISLFTLASALELLTGNMNMFIGLRFLQAVGGCAGMIIGRAVVRDLFQGQEAARVFSLMMLVQGVGPILAPVLGSLIMTFASWRWILVFLTGFGLFCLALTTFGLPETLPESRRTRLGLGRLWRVLMALMVRRDFIVPTLSGGVALSSLFAFISGSPFVLMHLHGVSPGRYGLLFALNAAGMIVTGQINVLLLRRFRTVVLLRAALLLECCLAATLLAVADTTNLPLFLLSLFSTLALVPIIGANSTALAMEASGRNAGNASTIIGVLQFCLAGLASALVSLLHNDTAYPLAGLICSCAVIGTAVQLLGGSGKGGRARERAISG